MSKFADIETRRSRWEELERIEQALSERITHFSKWLPADVEINQASSLSGHSKRSQRQTLTQQLDAQKLVKRYKSIANELIDKNDEPRSEDSNQLGPSDVQKLFEADLSKITSLPDGPSQSMQAIYQRGLSKVGLGRYLSQFTADQNVDALFDPTEEFGRYLNLTSLHDMFLNIPDSPKISYRNYLKVFSDFDDSIYISIQELPAYRKYVAELKQYLEGFYNRTHHFKPLEECIEMKQVLSEVQEETNDPLYCTACQKLFGSEGVFNAHLTGRKHKQALKTTPSNSASSKSSDNVEINEKIVAVLAKLLAPEVERTMANLVRRLGLTDNERQLEIQILQNEIQRENEENSDDDNNDTDSSMNKNTKQRYGPDGTPIPHWLWKLNGLSSEFSCEICGNYTYVGRKVFERHFSESRHANALKFLGIIPSPAYNGISVIDEVLKLNKKMKAKSNDSGDAEIEDDQGNVMTVKMYEDLKRQGLI